MSEPTETFTPFTPRRSPRLEKGWSGANPIDQICINHSAIWSRAVPLDGAIEICICLICGVPGYVFYRLNAPAFFAPCIAGQLGPSFKQVHLAQHFYIQGIEELRRLGLFEKAQAIVDVLRHEAKLWG